MTRIAFADSIWLSFTCNRLIGKGNGKIKCWRIICIIYSKNVYSSAHDESSKLSAITFCKVSSNPICQLNPWYRMTTWKDQPFSFALFIIINIARVQNCPDVTILNSLFGLCLLSFCVFVFFLFGFLSFCLFVSLFFCLFVFLSGHHADQRSEGSQLETLKSQKSLFVSKF